MFIVNHSRFYWKILHNINRMASRATIPEYRPSVTGKPGNVMLHSSALERTAILFSPSQFFLITNRFEHTSQDYWIYITRLLNMHHKTFNIHHKILSIHHKIIEYTSQDYRMYITRFWTYITRYTIYITRFSNKATFYMP